VGLELPDGIAATPITDPADQIETAIAWRNGDPSPTNSAFRDAAQAVFSDSVGGALAASRNTG
jgi:hypothetical protein